MKFDHILTVLVFIAMALCVKTFIDGAKQTKLRNEYAAACAAAGGVYIRTGDDPHCLAKGALLEVQR